MARTALDVALKMDLPVITAPALRYNVHPQNRTEVFHEIFNAPIRDEDPDMEFSHMDDQRVAFRASFIISEAFEILEKGLGLKVSIGVSGSDGEEHVAFGSQNSDLCRAILAAMNGGYTRNVIQVVDGLGDLNVVVNGWAVELGADMNAVDREILASNFTKLDDEGNPVVADGSDPKYPAGKILKSKNFVEPNIAAVLGLE